jgi:hypothetical protein
LSIPAKKQNSQEEGHKAKRRLNERSGQNAVATPLQPRETRHWRMACVSITSGLPGNCRFSDTPGMLDECLGDLSLVDEIN